MEEDESLKGPQQTDEPGTPPKAPEADPLEFKDSSAEEIPGFSNEGGSLPVQPPHRLRKRTPPQEAGEGAEEGSAGPDGEWVPFRSTWKPSPHTWPPLAESWAQAQKAPDKGRLRRDEPVVEPTRPTADAPGSGLAQQSATPALTFPGPQAETLLYPRPQFGSREDAGSRRTGTEMQDESAPQTPEAGAFWLRPLIWLDRGFESTTSWAGPPGRWLAGSVGRTILGVVGLLGLAGAVGLVVSDWLGWTW